MYQHASEITLKDAMEPIPVGDKSAVIHRCEWEDLAAVTVIPNSLGPMLEFLDLAKPFVEPAEGDVVVGMGYPTASSVILEEGRTGPLISRAVVLSPTPFSGTVLTFATRSNFQQFDANRHYLFSYDLAGQGKHPRGISGAAVWVQSSKSDIVWTAKLDFAGVCTSCYRNGTIEQVVNGSVVHQFLSETFGSPEQERTTKGEDLPLQSAI
jgi:hypothetical protein